MIVGLGNPGRKYQKTRHNAGFWFLDELVDLANATWRQESRFQCLYTSIKVQGESVHFIKPQNFMNRSGQAVGLVARYYKIATDDILVAHDELDFEAGITRFKKTGGHGGHNGLRDIINNLGSKDFARLRIGIGRPKDTREVTNFVLSEPGKLERNDIDHALNQVLIETDLLYQGDFEALMMRLH